MPKREKIYPKSNRLLKKTSEVNLMSFFALIVLLQWDLILMKLRMPVVSLWLL
jgi:hypothetical protein